MKPAGALWLLAVLTVALGGCQAGQVEYAQLADELALAKATVEKLQQNNLDLQKKLSENQIQIRNLQNLGDKRVEMLLTVESIDLGKHTGGVDLDGQAGDDAIKVFLRPMDADGSVIKAAGDVKIQLFDLAAEPEDNLLGEYRWAADEISQQWSSGFMAYHFSFVCPFKVDKIPAHDQITVRVEFIDYLTGKTHSAQQLCKIKLAAKGIEKAE